MNSSFRIILAKFACFAIPTHEKAIFIFNRYFTTWRLNLWRFLSKLPDAHYHRISSKISMFRSFYFQQGYKKCRGY